MRARDSPAEMEHCAYRRLLPWIWDSVSPEGTNTLELTHPDAGKLDFRSNYFFLSLVGATKLLIPSRTFRAALRGELRGSRVQKKHPQNQVHPVRSQLPGNVQGTQCACASLSCCLWAMLELLLSI
jgi:hypothetical protein